jgi:hypothetical protein
MTRHEEPVRSSRKSYTFYPVDSPELAQRMETAVSFEGFYTYLLHQDLDHVVPYRLGRDDRGEVRMVGQDAERASELVAAALSDRDYHPSLDDGVRDFFGTAAQYLVLGGPVTYEIEYLYRANAPEDAAPEWFRLHLIQPGTLGERNGRPIQFVLPTISSLHDTNGLPYVDLDPSALVRFTLPAELAKPVRRLVSFLKTANAEQGSELALVEQAMTGSSSFSFDEYRRQQRDLFAKITEPVGWNARDLFTEGQLEPFGVWRQIRFLEFKVKLRNKICEDLNAAISQVGEKMGFEAKLELDGLPTLDTVESLKNDFRSGRLGFGDLITSMI